MSSHDPIPSRARRGEHGLTLLELLVVLAILAALAGTALRATSQLQLEARDRASQQTLHELEDSVLGGGDDESGAALDGFVADLGRRPRSVLEDLEEGGRERRVLSLAELWTDPGPDQRWDVRAAIPEHGVAVAHQDPEVFVSGGWRGPYLRWTADRGTLRDGHGVALVNPIGTSPLSELHLFDPQGRPIRRAGVEVGEVRSLGSGDGSVYDRTRRASFADARLRCALHVVVTVEQGDLGSGSRRDDAVPDPADRIQVRVYGPDPERPGKIAVRFQQEAFDAPSIRMRFEDLPVGPRVLRAALIDDRFNGAPTSSHEVSEVRELRLRPGLNLVRLRIDRRRGSGG